MTAPTTPGYRPVSPMAFALNWWKPLGTPTQIGAKKWTTGGSTVYRWFTIIDAPRRGFVTYPVFRAHTLVSGTPNHYTDAEAEARRTDDRAQVLVEYPGWVPNLLYFQIDSAAHEEAYGAESVATRFVSEYRCAFAMVSTS